MRLFISLSGSSVNELRFDRGPIYLGRQKGSQVFLPDPAISRQHAVFYTTRDGTWILEDLGSANKTYLNGKAIHKSELKNNDNVQIADFQIRVKLDQDEDQDQMQDPDKEETLVGAATIRTELHTVERKPEASDAPPFRFPAKRVKDYAEALESICHQKSIKTLYETLEEILLRQFRGYHVWISLRLEAGGPMDVQGGRKITTESVKRLELAVPKSLEESLEHKRYLLIHQLPRQIINRGIRSVIIVPVLHKNNCHGILYLENSTEHTHYTLADLDYLILLSVFTGIAIQRIAK